VGTRRVLDPAYLARKKSRVRCATAGLTARQRWPIVIVVVERGSTVARTYARRAHRDSAMGEAHRVWRTGHYDRVSVLDGDGVMIWGKVR
jgi:hypothetical protein